jgi:hypothetical protein
MTIRLYDEAVVIDAVRGRCTRRPWPAEAEEVVKRLIEAGYSDGQTAVRAQRTRRSVIRIRERLGLPSHLAGTNGHTRPHDAPSTKPGEW